MKKIKILFWLIIIGLISLIFFQNKDFFFGSQALSINFVVKSYQTPEINIAILFAGFFAAGLLIAYFSSLLIRYKNTKTIKNLNNTIKEYYEKISSLENDIASLKTVPTDAATSEPTEPETDTESA
jgi:hypothetical protein